MRFKICCILIGLALGDLGAAQARETGRYGRPADRDAGRTSQSFDPQEVETKTRIIGLLGKGGGDCPPVPGWAAERLVDAALKSGYRCEPWRPGPEDRALIRDLWLDRFCVYTTDQARSFDRPKGLLAARPDRMALSASANDLETAVWKPLAATFKNETGAGTAFGMPGAPSVRLTILDSQPDGDGVPGTPPAGSQHGYTLMHLARELACPAPGQCAAGIASRRALGYANFDPKFDPEQPLAPFQAHGDQGGDIGTVSDLGSAIFAEVLHWRHTGSPGHLILNLSLGWDGEMFNDLDVASVSKLRPDVLYVYQALRFAARNGVLVIAAAGNQRGGQQPSHWPLLPAAWEMRRPSWWGPLFHRRRLVYSVGGVDWQGLPLPNSRNGGRPRRVAYGDHAVADRGQGQPTAIYTGSSVSTAVVSSIAAVVWHLRPELRPDEVMRLIDRSGETQPMRADFYPWRTVWPLYLLVPPPQLSQVSLCKAVESACGPGGARCPTLTPAPASCRLAHQPSQLSGLPPPPTTPAFVAESLPPASIAMCGPKKQLFRPDPDPKPGVELTGAHICPSTYFGSVASQRWTFPQPDAVPCSGCSLEPPSLRASLPVETLASLAPPSNLTGIDVVYTLHLQISEDWRPPKLTAGTLLPDATLDLNCFDGSLPAPVKTYLIDFDPLDPDLQPIPDIARDSSLWGCTAQLTFVVQKSDGTTMSVPNPVTVAP